MMLGYVYKFLNILNARFGVVDSILSMGNCSYLLFLELAVISVPIIWTLWTIGDNINTDKVEMVIDREEKLPDKSPCEVLSSNSQYLLSRLLSEENLPPVESYIQHNVDKDFAVALRDYAVWVFKMVNKQAGFTKISNPHGPGIKDVDVWRSDGLYVIPQRVTQVAAHKTWREMYFRNKSAWLNLRAVFVLIFSSSGLIAGSSIHFDGLGDKNSFDEIMRQLQYILRAEYTCIEHEIKCFHNQGENGLPMSNADRQSYLSDVQTRKFEITATSDAFDKIDQMHTRVDSHDFKVALVRNLIIKGLFLTAKGLLISYSVVPAFLDHPEYLYDSKLWLSYKRFFTGTELGSAFKMVSELTNPDVAEVESSMNIEAHPSQRPHDTPVWRGKWDVILSQTISKSHNKFS